MSEHPYITIFPALRLRAPIDLGEWRIGTPAAGVAWRGKRFKDLVARLVASFGKAGFQDPAMLWNSENGFNGEAPEKDTALSIQAAVRFAVLDANDQVYDDLNAGHLVTTSENAEMYVQPIDEKHGRITVGRGGLLRQVLVGGWPIGKGPPPLPDAVVPLDRSVRASRKLARSIFLALDDASNPQSGRLRIAIEWHAAAMANPRAVTLQQRLIALKTGFEALLGTSKSRKCAGRLRALFETVTREHGTMLPWAGLLWSPAERRDLSREFINKEGNTQIDVRSELEDWFMKLTDARNEVIHEGRLTLTRYVAPRERPLSRYAGDLFWKGERILREAIKATLGVDILLCGQITAHRRIEKYAAALLADLASNTESAPEDAPVSDAKPEPPIPPVPASRGLEQLLAELNCSAANEVRLKKHVGGGSASLRVASKNERATRDQWEATADGRPLIVNPAECELLRDAGAELELDSSIDPCD